MALEDRIRLLRQVAIEKTGKPISDELQGVSKQRIEDILVMIGRSNQDQIDVVFALLDAVSESWFSNKKLPFCAGASTAHIACHVGILQRGGRKLDREGRDYWLKPMWEIGAIEKCYFHAASTNFISGHAIAKSSNCAYRLSEGFSEILKNVNGKWETQLEDWISEDRKRERLAIQAEAEKYSKALVDNKHSKLIALSKDVYVAQYLPGYQVIYIDDGDGDRITDEQIEVLETAGIEINLGDSMPDILLWNPTNDSLWVIEAVTSDGEVDYHKYQSMTDFCNRNGKQEIGFTTTYLTWKDVAIRQSKNKNLATETYLWIVEDGGKQLKII